MRTIGSACGRVCSLCRDPCKRQLKLGLRNQFTVMEMGCVRAQHASHSRKKIQIGATVQRQCGGTVSSDSESWIRGISAALGTI